VATVTTGNSKALARGGVGGWSIGARERELVLEVLDSNVLWTGDNGEKTSQFEEGVARLHDRRLAIYLNSGTTAIQIALAALKRLRGWDDGDEILVPAVTFVGTINPVIYNNLIPVFVDVDPEHFDMAPDQIEQHITPRTRAIVPVHFLGQPCMIERIMEIANAHDLVVIEDSCETNYVKRNGKVVASWGEIACFSTFMVHMLQTGIGGFVLTDDIPLAEKMKQLINHANPSYRLSFDGDRPVWTSRSDGSGWNDVGYSFRVTEMEAAIGVAQLERREEIVGAYQRNAERLTENLSDLRGQLQLPFARPGGEHSYFRYALTVKDPKRNRDGLMEHLAAHGIPVKYNFPLLNQPVYVERFGDLEPRYPVAASVNRDGLLLGCHVGLNLDDMDRQSELIHQYFAA
jgi:perosamine synthetase